MSRWGWVLVLALSCLAGSASAQTVASLCGASYAVAPGTKCMLLGSQLSQTGGETSAGPILLNIKPGEVFTQMCVAYGSADSACEPGIAKIKWSAKSAAAAPAVWNDLATLTGVGSTFVSGYCGPIVGPNFRAELDGDSNGTQSAITDTDCNTNKVDIVITLYP